jgi:hypothetical protein
VNLNQPKGTKHTPTHRRTLSGRLVPLATKPAPQWNEIFGAAPQAPLRWFEGGHPSRKHDVEPPSPVTIAPEDVVSHFGSFSRRVRRQNVRLILKAWDRT